MNITMEDIPFNPDWTRLDILAAAVCEHVLDKEKEAEIVKETFNQQISSRQDRLMREKNLKRHMDHEEKYRIVAKTRNFKRTKSETGEMPQIVKNRINQLEKDVKEVKLIIEKGIYKTDASEPHNRLSIRTTQIYLCMYSNDNRRNLKKVRVIDPSLDVDELEIRRWEMNMSVSYMLNGKWIKMRIRNKIKKGDRIQIWALSPDEEDEGDQEDDDDDEVNIEEQKDSDSINNLCSLGGVYRLY
ncbi:hypothetical protein R3W88_010197 [Solanum pinnatisectum]|uniref:Uncharacterized protein n=1 Tax=Solanum pinnatisectum TaxID=50273 RepID=A0AAV9MDK7_9SOLN|nr:hypothetical protein R3W88_010197 [Solanum pinnatisectum]